MDFRGMKRKDLQALCKKHGIPANLKNIEMANRLASVFEKETEEIVSETTISPDGIKENQAVGKKAKKVTFSPESENQVFEFSRSVKKLKQKNVSQGTAQDLQQGGIILRRSTRLAAKSKTGTLVPAKRLNRSKRTADHKLGQAMSNSPKRCSDIESAQDGAFVQFDQEEAGGANVEEEGRSSKKRKRVSQESEKENLQGVFEDSPSTSETKAAEPVIFAENVLGSTPKVDRNTRELNSELIEEEREEKQEQDTVLMASEEKQEQDTVLMASEEKQEQEFDDECTSPNIPERHSFSEESELEEAAKSEEKKAVVLQVDCDIFTSAEKHFLLATDEGMKGDNITASSHDLSDDLTDSESHSLMGDSVVQENHVATRDFRENTIADCGIASQVSYSHELNSGEKTAGVEFIPKSSQTTKVVESPHVDSVNLVDLDIEGAETIIDAERKIDILALPAKEESTLSTNIRNQMNDASEELATTDNNKADGLIKAKVMKNSQSGYKENLQLDSSGGPSVFGKTCVLSETEDEQSGRTILEYEATGLVATPFEKGTSLTPNEFIVQDYINEEGLDATQRTSKQIRGHFPHVNSVNLFDFDTEVTETTVETERNVPLSSCVLPLPAEGDFETTSEISSNLEVAGTSSMVSKAGGDNVEEEGGSSKKRKTVSQEFELENPQGMAEDSPSTSETKAAEPVIFSENVLDSTPKVSVDRNTNELNSELMIEEREEKQEQDTVLMAYGDSEKTAEKVAAEFHDESASTNIPERHPFPEESELEEAAKSEEKKVVVLQADCDIFITVPEKHFLLAIDEGMKGENITARSHDLPDVLTDSADQSLMGDIELAESKDVELLAVSNISTNLERHLLSGDSGLDGRRTIIDSTTATCKTSFVFVPPERTQLLEKSEPHTAGKHERKEVEFKEESGQDRFGNSKSGSSEYQSHHVSSLKVMLKDDNVVQESHVAARDFRENTIADSSGSIESPVFDSHELNSGEKTAGAEFKPTSSQAKKVVESPRVDSVNLFEFHIEGAETIMDAERNFDILAVPAKEESSPSTNIQNQMNDASEELAITDNNKADELIKAKVMKNSESGYKEILQLDSSGGPSVFGKTCVFSETEDEQSGRKLLEYEATGLVATPFVKGTSLTPNEFIVQDNINEEGLDATQGTLKQIRGHFPHVNSVNLFDFDTEGTETTMETERNVPLSSCVLPLPAEGDFETTSEISSNLEVAGTSSMVSKESAPSTDTQTQINDALEEMAIADHNEADELIEAKVTKNLDSSGGSSVSEMTCVLGGTEHEQLGYNSEVDFKNTSEKSGHKFLKDEATDPISTEKDIPLGPDESTVHNSRNEEAAEEEMIKRETTPSLEETRNESSENRKDYLNIGESGALSEKQARREPMLIYRTQVKPKMQDMKENAPNSKIVDNLNVTAPRTSKRQPLQDLRKN
ncbi:uncharacterized protein LOC18008546 [Eutrema salsugineum]|uniref:uncharacterized protein LOC18008546 n=1 Tax=Eutrema salsugineum TaxID=72664 RepID=UPI000CED7394|nr:uncharacterized protein LOC18008546 [Eutrema salsugineum]